MSVTKLRCEFPTCLEVIEARLATSAGWKKEGPVEHYCPRHCRQDDLVWSDVQGCLVPSAEKELGDRAARLRAAAPDLLAACQEAAEYLDGYVVDEDAGAADPEINRLHRTLCAAIAKAE